jgi:hypothetical protein
MKPGDPQDFRVFSFCAGRLTREFTVHIIEEKVKFRR